MEVDIQLDNVDGAPQSRQSYGGEANGGGSHLSLPLNLKKAHPVSGNFRGSPPEVPFAGSSSPPLQSTGSKFPPGLKTSSRSPMVTGKTTSLRSKAGLRPSSRSPVRLKTANSTLTRGPGLGAAPLAAGASQDFYLGSSDNGSRAHCSELDLASCERLPIKHDLHRPDSVITTSSVVSSEAPSVVDEVEEKLTPAPPSSVPHSVYTISGLYGSSVSHTPSAETVKDLPRTHKRSTSSTAASIVLRGCQMTHKRSHSHTVGYGQTVANHHRRTGSSGFVMGHRRTASGALVDTLDKITGGAIGMKGEIGAQSTPKDFLTNIQKQQQGVVRRASSSLEEVASETSGEERFRECGYPGCHPLWCQVMANIKVFVLLLSVLVTLQQALSSGYLNSVITTIEKRYEIPSSISGIVASMYEIGNVGTVVFVSYLGSRRHIPVWIGTGVILMGLGSIIFSLPHFLSESYSSDPLFGPNMTDENICKISYHKSQPSILDQLQLGELDQLLDSENVKGLSNPPLVPHNTQFNRDDNCIKEASSSSAMPIFIFMIAQLLLGCGGSPLFTLGTTYIDDHVKRDEASMYIGFMYSMVAFGPVLGFLLGAYLLNHYVDTFSHDLSLLEIDPSSRHWVGMWWGGFLIIGVLMLIISIPFFAFPKHLKWEKRKIYLEEKNSHNNKENKTKQREASGELSPEEQQEKVDNYGKDLSDLPRCIWKLLTNQIYLVTCLGACMELIIVSGFIVFLPKYLETQFNLSKSEASMLTGGTAIPGACIGIFLGGYILKRLQLRPAGAVKLVLFFNFLCLGCNGLLFFLGCNNVAMAGTTMPYTDTEIRPAENFQINLTASCNFGCSCDMNDVQPVCGANGLTYFSPCHAGCTSLLSSHNYTNCACVGSHGETIGPDGNEFEELGGVTRVPVATAGPCYTTCDMILPFMVLLFFMTLLVAVTQMPVLMVVLRSVEEEEKAFALGIQFVIFRLFGYIPSPILFGNVIDSTCIMWKQTCEGAKGGRCLMYDIEMFRYKYVGICVGIKTLSFLIFMFDLWLIKRRQQQDKEQTGLTVGEVVNSIVSLDKMFTEAEEEAGDPEEGYHGLPSASDSAPCSPAHQASHTLPDCSPNRQPTVSSSAPQ